MKQASLQFKPVPNPPRETKSFRITAEATDTLNALAEAYQTSQGRVLEELLSVYGEQLLKDAKNA